MAGPIPSDDFRDMCDSITTAYSQIKEVQDRLRPYKVPKHPEAGDYIYRFRKTEELLNVASANLFLVKTELGSIFNDPLRSFKRRMSNSSGVPNVDQAEVDPVSHQISIVRTDLERATTELELVRRRLTSKEQREVLTSFDDLQNLLMQWIDELNKIEHE